MGIQLDMVAYGSLPLCPLPVAESTEHPDGVPALTVIYSVYVAGTASDRFEERLREYETYDEKLKRRIELVLVDDCSAVNLRLPPDLDLNVRLFRVNDDVAWNSCGGRNLGAVAASTEKLIMCDIDHLVPAQTLSTVLNSRVDMGDWILLERVDKVTANIYATTRRTYFYVGGYDEQFSGCYGDDLPFRHKLKEHGLNFLRPGLLVERRGFHNHGLSRDLAEMHRRLEAWNGKPSGRFVDFSWSFVEATRVGTRDG